MVKELILKEHDCYSDKCIIISGKCKVNKNIFTNHLQFVSSRSIIKVKNKQQLNQRKIYKIMFKIITVLRKQIPKLHTSLFSKLWITSIYPSLYPLYNNGEKYLGVPIISSDLFYVVFKFLNVYN